jgi:hypothetical protein
MVIGPSFDRKKFLKTSQIIQLIKAAIVNFHQSSVVHRFVNSCCDLGLLPQNFVLLKPVDVLLAVVLVQTKQVECVPNNLLFNLVI